LKTEVGETMPIWGMSTSPLVVGDKVIVNPGIKDKPRLMAFNVKTGEPVYAEGAGSDGYSSPQFVELFGVPQVLIFTNGGLASHDPATGKQLWLYEWVVDGSSSAVTQPNMVVGNKIILGAGRIGLPSRCIEVTLTEAGWEAKDVLSVAKFSPGFNDFVQHDGAIYGLEGGRIVCVDIETGKVLWRDGKFGGGQVLLVGDKILVQAEAGEVVLIKASKTGLEEIATLPALNDKTWNHPVVANGHLIVRNAREVVCFDLNK